MVFLQYCLCSPLYWMVCEPCVSNLSWWWSLKSRTLWLYVSVLCFSVLSKPSASYQYVCFRVGFPFHSDWLLHMWKAWLILHCQKCVLVAARRACPVWGFWWRRGAVKKLGGTWAGEKSFGCSPKVSLFISSSGLSACVFQSGSSVHAVAL